MDTIKIDIVKQSLCMIKNGVVVDNDVSSSPYFLRISDSNNEYVILDSHSDLHILNKINESLRNEGFHAPYDIFYRAYLLAKEEDFACNCFEMIGFNARVFVMGLELNREIAILIMNIIDRRIKYDTSGSEG